MTPWIATLRLASATVAHLRANRWLCVAFFCRLSAMGPDEDDDRLFAPRYGAGGAGAGAGAGRRGKGPGGDELQGPYRCVDPRHQSGS